MPEFLGISGHRKWRRRRPEDKPPLSAVLQPETELEGDVGLISDDLLSHLFPASQPCPDDSESFPTDHHVQDSAAKQTVRYVAVSPLDPTIADDLTRSSWTILAVSPIPPNSKAGKSLAHSTICFPAFSSAIRFLRHSSHSVGSRVLRGKGHFPPINVRVLDIVPLHLHTIWVKVDQQASARTRHLSPMPQGHWCSRDAIFQGDPDGHARMEKTSSGQEHQSPDRQEVLRTAVRDSLRAAHVVNAGNVYCGPSIKTPGLEGVRTHISVELCEPISQGLVSKDTRVVLSRIRQQKPPSLKADKASTLQGRNVTSEGGESSDDQFHSAAEDADKISSSPTSPSDQDSGQVSIDLASSDASDSDVGNISESSEEDIISLHDPTLDLACGSPPAPLSSGSMLGRHNKRQLNGHLTPTSVHSDCTNTTTRGSRSHARLCKIETLKRRLPDDALHPRPSSDEDDESRVLVGLNTLTKIGCFSGDWVRVESASEAPVNEPGQSLSDDVFGEDFSEHESEWRIAKVYSLPDMLNSHSLVSSQPMFESCRQQGAQPLRAWISPILHTNLGSPKFLRLVPLIARMSLSINATPSPSAKTLSAQDTETSRPPVAREVTLLKLSTPRSTDRMLQDACLAGLKRYFELRQRLVKSGDLVPISIDTHLGSLFQQATPQSEDATAAMDLLSDTSTTVGRGPTTAVNRQGHEAVWFKVGQINMAPSASSQDDRESIWGGVAAVDSGSTRMIQAGLVRGKVPSVQHSPWESYLSIKAEMCHSLTNFSKPSHSPSDVNIAPIRRRLQELVTASTSPRAIQLGLPPLAILLKSSQRAIGKAYSATRACADLGIHVFEIDAYEILTENGGGDVKTEAFFKARWERAMSCGAEYCAPLIRHIDALTSDRMVSVFKEVVAESRVSIATTTDVEKIPEGVRALFTHELEMMAPDEGERRCLLQAILQDRGLLVSPAVDLAGVAVKTAALVAGDLIDVVDRALVAKQSRIERLTESAKERGVTPRDVILSGGDAGSCLMKVDFEVAIEAARKNFADSIGAPKIPNVTWDDVGGLANVKDAVMETIQLPLERPELFAKGMKKRSGILFYGPPGTGKTLLAKAIATEFSLNFFSIKGPELLNMYIGESEANVRRVFQRARDARPCVVFFDELDSVAPKRGNQGDSGGVMDRIVSQLLAELDGMSDGKDGGGGVFVIGATNRPDLLDAALLRPGRFDKMLYLGVADTHDKQLTILEALTRKFVLHPSLSLRRVAETLPFTYTGADLYALCSDAMLKAITRQARSVDEKIKVLPDGPVSTAYFFDHLATAEDTAVVVTEGDFVSAQQELVSSVSAKEIEHYDRVRKMFEAPDESPSAEPQHGQISRASGGNAVDRKGKGKATSPVEDGSSAPVLNGHDHQRVDGTNEGTNGYVVYSGRPQGQINGASVPAVKAANNTYQDPSLDDEHELYG